MRQLALITKRRTHIAVMRPAWGLLEKIILGEKRVELRCYRNRSIPWNRISVGDTIYFKNAGEPVTAKAEAAEVLQYENLTTTDIKKLLNKYAAESGIGKGEIETYLERFRTKRYCLVILLKNAKGIKPFEIDKTGFGNQTAWLIVEDLEKIKQEKLTQPKLLGC